MMVAFPPPIEHLVDQIYPVARQHLAIELAAASRSLYWIDVILQLALLALVFFSGVAARVRAALERRIHQPFLLTTVYIALFVIALSIAMLPTTYYASFTLPHRFGLSEESFSRWLCGCSRGRSRHRCGRGSGAPARYCSLPVVARDRGASRRSAHLFRQRGLSAVDRAALQRL